MASTTLLKNVGLDDAATSKQTFDDDEPTAASSGDEVFVTGNVYASRSSDGGTTWTFVDPFSTFPATEGGFCCDQITVFAPSRNLWAWLLQYRTGPTGSNIVRLAVSTSGKPENWTFFDFAPGGVDAQWATDVMFDYPHMATSDNHLYFSFNVFKNSTGQFLAAVVFKIALDGLASNDLTGAVEVFRSPRFGLCLTQGATTEMFFGTHLGVGSQPAPLTVFRWPDAQGSQVSRFDVQPSPWGGRIGRGAFSSRGPGGEWLAKLDSRISGAWAAGNEAGFLWAAVPRQGRPQPYVKAAIVDTTTEQLVAEPDIFSAEVAWAYPAAAPNADGRVGASLCFGGGQFNPGHAVGFLDGHDWVFPFASTKVSTDGPAFQVWGDYLTVAPHYPEARSWVTAGFTLQGGNSHENMEPRYVEFAAGP
jgi:hypothetical protein